MLSLSRTPGKISRAYWQRFTACAQSVLPTAARRPPAGRRDLAPDRPDALRLRLWPRPHLAGAVDLVLLLLWPLLESRGRRAALARGAEPAGGGTVTTAMTPDALTPAMERLCAAAFGPECEVRWWGSGTGAAVTVHIAALVPGMTADTAGVSWCLDGAWTIHDPAELEVV